MADPTLQWHYVRKGITFGPVDTPALVRLASSRDIRPDTPVWNASFGSDWRPAGAVPELAAAFSAPPSDISGPATPATLPPPFPETDAAPSPLAAFRSAWAWARQALLRPYRFFQWLLLWIAFWLATTGGTVAVLDSQTLFNEAPRVRGAIDLVPLFVKALHKGVESIFDPATFGSWLLLFAFFSFATCYFRARGRLMLVHFADHPRDPLSSAWRRARPGLWPLVIFHFILDLLKAAIVLACVRRFADALPAQTETMSAKALLRALPADNAMLLWLSAGVVALAAIALIRSATYHFAEPLVYRFGMRTRHAWLYIAALFLRHPLSFLGYYLALAILHLALWAVVGAILLGFAIATLPVAMFAAPLAAAFAAFLPALARFAAIPFLYTLRCAGPRFLDAWRKDLR